jgi:hypothetical protein
MTMCGLKIHQFGDVVSPMRWRGSDFEELLVFAETWVRAAFIDTLSPDTHVVNRDYLLSLLL